MQMEKCKFSICFSQVLPESSFRRHINKKGTKLEEDLNKIDGDYYIGEYRKGKRHEHGWFVYIAIIHNNIWFKFSNKIFIEYSQFWLIKEYWSLISFLLK